MEIQQQQNEVKKRGRKPKISPPLLPKPIEEPMEEEAKAEEVDIKKLIDEIKKIKADLKPITKAQKEKQQALNLLYGKLF